uniref:Uncharacterized protein n=1 Tax=Oncorhynchus kisutch TaxID=8019 RepID=A0A8C7II22_ONCKI
MCFFLFNGVEFKPFFREETPVTHLYFCRTVIKAMLGHIGLHFTHLEELVVCANGLQLLDEELFRIAESPEVEFVKMCGKRLTQMSIISIVNFTFVYYLLHLLW